MSILNPNTAIPFNITRLSHVVLTSKDLDKTRYFYESGLGLEVTSHEDTHLCLRAIEETGHHSLVFEKSDGPGVARQIGYRMFSDDDLKRAYDYFNEQGHAAKFIERPYQGLTLQLDDGVGVPVEFCATMDQTENRMQRFHTHAGGRLAFLDHVQIACHDVAGAYQWYNDLGFRLTEYTAKDGTDEMWGVWLKRKNNTQDVVFGNGPGPRLHHFAFHTPEISSIIHAADVMASLDLAGSMDRAPGRHGIGNAFFIYFRDPDGHRVEIFSSHYNVIDIDHAPKRWELTDTRRSQLWGFPAPRKWFMEASAFEGVAVKDPLVNAPPVTLEDFLANW
ncbi:3,4-dihydroxyphenylacetate 2,3-dioxygenase [uncultured Ruegeria sp.]|uniref:3,4-dihydroxyphenylacetate 2,3-dioxygenase n=1 Tax=uncultured Ruegeria sp. TaxID=259304 RepID=UPI00263A342D|nr:3,4-dihydroxyphenylacetate 2,3-dioxygenase [uncultured Ruegeria sp.]